MNANKHKLGLNNIGWKIVKFEGKKKELSILINTTKQKSAQKQFKINKYKSNHIERIDIIEKNISLFTRTVPTPKDNIEASNCLN